MKQNFQALPEPEDEGNLFPKMELSGGGWLRFFLLSEFKAGLNSYFLNINLKNKLIFLSRYGRRIYNHPKWYNPIVAEGEF